MKKGLLIVLGLVAILGVTTLLYGVSTSNQEIGLRNLGTAQQETCEAYFDKMWKVLQQQAGVATQYKDAFADIYPKLMDGRYGTEKGGTLMKWIQESNPDFDVTLYAKLSNSIEAQREGFFNEQKKMISINQQHTDLLTKFPTSMFVGSREVLDYTIVKSFKTKKVYESGEENDIDLFN